MVTTDEDNVVKGDVTERDMFGNVTTYVEVASERIDSVITGSNARRSTVIYPLILIIVTLSALVVGGTFDGVTLLGAVALMLLAVWSIGVTRR